MGCTLTRRVPPAGTPCAAGKLTRAGLNRFKLLLKEPGAEGADEEDSEAVIRTKAVEKGVLALPGTVFLPDGGKTPYVRAAFSLLEEPDVEEAMKRLREVVLEARGSS